MATRARAGAARAFARADDAVAAVETAFVALLLLVFVFAVIDFGRALFLYNTLQDVARRAARMFAVQGADPCSSAAATQMVQDSVHAWVHEFGGPQQPASAYAVTAGCLYGSAASPGVATYDTVAIVRYPFSTLTPLIGFAGLAQSTCGGAAATGSVFLCITKSAGARNEAAPDGY